MKVRPPKGEGVYPLLPANTARQHLSGDTDSLARNTIKRQTDGSQEQADRLCVSAEEGFREEEEIPQRRLENLGSFSYKTRSEKNSSTKERGVYASRWWSMGG